MSVRTFVTTVTDVQRIGARMLQITCGGGDLVGFDPLGPDQFVFVLAPPPGHDTLTIDASFSWSQYEEMPADQRPVGAYYTVRRWRADESSLDLVVVTHGDEGNGSRWALGVTIGDPVALWGPRQVFDPPSSADRLLLVGDDTAVPAIARILESLPAHIGADVFIEVDDEADDLPLPERSDVTVARVYRRGIAAGTAGTLLDAVRSYEPPADSTLYAWGGAESHEITAVRRHVRDVLGLDRDLVAMTGYWRLQV